MRRLAREFIARRNLDPRTQSVGVVDCHSKNPTEQEKMATVGWQVWALLSAVFAAFRHTGPVESVTLVSSNAGIRFEAAARSARAWLESSISIMTLLA
jgi:hypothetical protein